MPATTYVALLRGINVGKTKRMSMADLRSVVEATGATDVQTYIQSGNVVFRSTKGEATVVAAIESGIESSMDFDVPVIVRSAKELAAVVKANPYGEPEDPTKLVVAFLPKKPMAGAAKAVEAIDQDAFAPERFTLHGRELYFDLPNGQGKMKLSYAKIDKALGQETTARNWKTVLTLLDMTTA